LVFKTSVGEDFALGAKHPSLDRLILNDEPTWDEGEDASALTD
jgi:hypothetical protein